VIADLKPYPEYKESGLPWLGQVPEHWELKRAKSSVSNVVEQATQMDSGDVYIALENIESWTGHVRPQKGEHLFTGQVKRFRSGDVLFGKLRPYLAKVTRLQCGGVCVGELFVLRPRNACMRSDFLEQQLRTKHTIDVVNASTFGAKMPRADWQFVGNLSLVFPSPAEQVAIVQFLDWANGRLEWTIRAKRKVIALLIEQKQVIIHRAITRGIDPSVSLKSSGIPWLGDVPTHWSTTRLKHCITRIEQGWSPQCDAQRADEEEWGVLKVGCVNKEEFRGEQNKKLPSSLTPDPSLEIADGDILVSRANTRELLGLAALVIQPRRKLILCDKLFRFRPKSTKFDGRFLVYCLRGKTSRAQIESSTNGASSSMQNIGQGVLKNLWVSAPSVDEQKCIVSFIEKATNPLTTAIKRLEREIEFLREYQTRLTADVVTGKLDIREAATRLPGEGAPEPEILDEADLIDEAELEGEEVAA
jgi:type I restriction enzyme S subunit